ncbi:MAG TPA: zf-HC2 domain-containing protein [Aeromonadales bacterium]|nr:zf-HC2 domain-containing protein [Aeromonadales bacterium]
MFLSCKDVTDLSSEYIDNELDWSVKLKIRFHLLMCGYCRKFVRHMDITHEYVKKQQTLNYIGGQQLDEKVDIIMAEINKARVTANPHSQTNQSDDSSEVI